MDKSTYCLDLSQGIFECKANLEEVCDHHGWPTPLTQGAVDVDFAVLIHHILEKCSALGQMFECRHMSISSRKMHKLHLTKVWKAFPGPFTHTNDGRDSSFAQNMKTSSRVLTTKVKLWSDFTSLEGWDAKYFAIGMIQCPL